MRLFAPDTSPLTSADEALSLRWHGRAILLVDLDAFFASVEQLDHPEWRGKPVIVGGDAHKRGVVATASYEARTFGVHSAMPASQAARLCPDAIWTGGNFARYREVSKQVMSILHAESPFVQQVSIDEAFVDVTPTRSSHEHPVAIAMRIREKVAHIGVTCSVGCGVSKSVAKVASDFDKPDGLTAVFPGAEKGFLAALPIKVMSGIGPATQRSLTQYGIRTLGDVAHADSTILHEIFGKNAQMMRERCLGADMSPVHDDDTVKSVSGETSFAHDLTSHADIMGGIATMAAKVGRRMRRKGLTGTTLTLKVKYANMKSHTAQTQLPHASDNEYEWLPYLEELLTKLWSPGTAVRLVGVAIGGFDATPAPVQASLFDMGDADAKVSQDKKDIQAAHHLAEATDKVRERFGENAVRFGREIRSAQNTTGTAAKNPEDYK